MAKITLNDITSGHASTTALNDNFAAVETAFDNTLSRDGSSPNQMLADLDMNSRNILNVSTLNGYPIASFVGGVSDGGGTSTAISGTSTPSVCNNNGALFYNSAENILYICNGSAYTPVESEQSTKFSAITPGVCTVDGLLFFNTAESQIYVCQNGTYVPTAGDVVNPGIPYDVTTPGSCTIAGDLFYNSAEEKLYICNGTTYDQVVTEVPASSGASVPVSCTIVGGLFFNTTDEKLYTCNGATYTAATASASVVLDTATPVSCSLSGELLFNTVEEKLYVCDGSIYQLAVPDSAQIAAGSLTVAAFASSIRPVELFATLPTTGNTEGRLVYNTTDDKLYRYTGTAFTSAVPTTDLTGTISTGQLAANVVTADKISASAVTAGKIAAGAISATEIAAGAITTNELAANTILASNIATNAITSDKIAANAITSGKILAGTISATELAANAVTADKILAGAITSTKIAAGSIDANKIIAEAITADKIAAGAVTAVKIAAGAVTADKISSGTASISTGNTFEFGTATSVSGQPCTGIFNGSGKHGVVGKCTTNGPSGVIGWSTTGAGGAGVAGVKGASITASDYSGYLGLSSAGAIIYRGTTHGVALMNATYCISAGLGSGASYVHDGYLPFTGLHMGELQGNAEVGDILVDTDILEKKNISNVVFSYTASTNANQKRAIGVLNRIEEATTYRSNLLKNRKSEKETHHKAEADVLSIDQLALEEWVPQAGSKVVYLNAVGEGQINVCNQGGNIEAGDLIVCSSRKGKGMKQADDIVRGYTVAKARETVIFSGPNDIQQIACIYLCG